MDQKEIRCSCSRCLHGTLFKDIIDGLTQPKIDYVEDLKQVDTTKAYADANVGIDPTRVLAVMTEAEFSASVDRLDLAEALIVQFPNTHDGRNSWLMNYGLGEEAQTLRRKRGLKISPRTRAAVRESGELRSDISKFITRTSCL